MLQKENRLRKTKDFQRVLSAKQGIREGGLLVKRVQARAGSPRVGIVVSKKVAKKAVARNRIRRILQEAIRKEMPTLPKGADLVVVVTPEFQKQNPQDIHKVIHALFKKAWKFS